MDRRQRKTREAIFHAFTELLSKKDFGHITVGEIIEKADIGRATFYAHFETKDDLLKEFCEELFCHIFDLDAQETSDHRHLFACNGADSVFLHLFEHLQRNDNNILLLLSSENNDLFLRYFKQGLGDLVERQFGTLESFGHTDVPPSFLKHHVVSTIVETLRWWIENGMNESPETLTSYFLRVV